MAHAIADIVFANLNGETLVPSPEFDAHVRVALAAEQNNSAQFVEVVRTLVGLWHFLSGRGAHAAADATLAIAVDSIAALRSAGQSSLDADGLRVTLDHVVGALASKAPIPKSNEPPRPLSRFSLEKKLPGADG